MVSRNPIKENLANYKALSQHAAIHPLDLPPRTEDSSRTKFQRLRLLPSEIIRSLSSHFSSPTGEGWERGREKSRVSRGAQGETEITRAGPDVYDRSEP